LCIWRQIWAEDEQIEAWALGSGTKLTSSEVASSVTPIDPHTGQTKQLAQGGDIDWPDQRPFYYATDPTNIIDVHAWDMKTPPGMFWVKRTTAWELQATYPNDTTFSHPIVLYHKLIWQNWSGTSSPPNAGRQIGAVEQSTLWNSRRAEARLEYRSPVARGDRPALR